MKKIISILAGLAFAAATLNAIPAYPGPVKFRQPDGTYVSIVMHGDEFHHWVTSPEGTVLYMDSQGFYRSSGKKSSISRSSVSGASQARAARDAAFSRNSRSITAGSNKFLVLLIEFSDLSFTVDDAQKAFSNLLNQKGYSENGGTGSARDYYYENSSGQLDPEFTVIGPIKVSGKMAYYGANTSSGDNDYSKIGGMLAEAIDSVHNNYPKFKFSDYDNDGDGYVDNIYFYYAGFNEAQGGGDNTIWPHASGLSGKNIREYDDVKISRYACSSEYDGSGESNKSMAAIGTFCHEFGHVLGLPDFYDTDYDENGENYGMAAFSLMASGSYNDSGHTPPYLTAIERNLLGWMGEPTLITSDGTYSLGSIANNVAYKTPTTNEGEYYVYECRDGKGWDAGIKYYSRSETATGLLIYHVDQSDTKIAGRSAKERWNSWDGINAYYDESNLANRHPLCYVVAASENASDYADFTFPGKSSITEFSDLTSPRSESWDGIASGYNVTGIAFSGSQSTFTVTQNEERMVIGTVTDSEGNPIKDAVVSLTEETSSIKRNSIEVRSQSSLKRRASHTATTDSNGAYSVTLSESDGSNLILTVSKDGYKTASSSFTLSNGRIRKNFTLYAIGEEVTATLRKYTSIPGYGIGFNQKTMDVMVAVKFSADELSRYVGMKVAAINFLFYGTSADEVSAIIDIGGERAMTHKVDNPSFIKDNNVGWTTADVSNENVIIPEGKEIYFGYGLKQVADNTNSNGICYPIAIEDNGVAGGGYYFGNYTTTARTWYTLSYMGDDDEEILCNAIISVVLVEDTPSTEKYNVLTIITPSGGSTFTKGTTFSLDNYATGSADETVETATWYYDGSEVSGSSITFSSTGDHELKVVVKYTNGYTEETRQKIKVQ